MPAPGSSPWLFSRRADLLLFGGPALGSVLLIGLGARTIYGATLAPLAWWHATLPKHFHWLLAGDYVSGLPAWTGPLALASFGVVFVLWLAKESRRFATGRPVSWGKVLVVVTTALVWHLGIVVLDSDCAFAVTNVLLHGVPYSGLVFLSQRRTAASRASAGRPPVLADLGSRHAALFLVPPVFLAFLEEWGWDRLVWHENGAVFPGAAFDPGPVLLALLVPLLALPQATHYLLDAWIWKVRPENATAAEAIGLGLVEPPRDAGAG